MRGKFVCYKPYMILECNIKEVKEKFERVPRHPSEDSSFVGNPQETIEVQIAGTPYLLFRMFSMTRRNVDDSEKLEIH